MASITDLVNAKHGSNFQDVLVEYLEYLDNEIIEIHTSLAHTRHDREEEKLPPIVREMLGKKEE